jgi:hypothetical protein
MNISTRGILGAFWVTARALSLLALAFVVIRWSMIGRTPSAGDATPQLSFVVFVVLPVVAFALPGLVGDVWMLLRRSVTGSTGRLHRTFAVLSSALLAAALIRVYVGV